MLSRLKNLYHHDKAKDQKSKRIENILIEKIKPNPYQPRKEFSQKGLLELSESINQYGIIQPITVRPIGEDSYELIAGERRLRASKMLNMESIPAVIMDTQEEDSAILAMVENLQRENLHYMEEAKGYASLLNDHNLTQEELAKKVGKSQSTIANKIRILRLPDSIKTQLLSNNLTERHARALLKLPDEEIQNKIINKIIEKDLNVKDTENIIEKTLEKIMEEKENKPKRKFIKAYNDVRIILNTIKSVVETMEEYGLAAQYEQIDKGDSLEIILKIPKG